MKATRTLVFHGPERTDARSVKRIAALMDHGWHVLGFTFHRDYGQSDKPPGWENVHLGNTYSRRYVQRMVSVLRGFWIVLRYRERIQESACLYAINPDNALLALFARFVSRRKLPLVVEIADIQPVMTGAGVKSKILRAVERFVLKRCQLLLTTSPGFLRNYFEPVQRYRGPAFLLENRLYPATQLLEERRKRAVPVSEGRPWVIGYFGVLRCERSIDLICRLAEALPDKVAFEIRGVPAGIDESSFRERIGRHANIRFGGRYRYPDDLAAMYGAVDLNWCFDFSAFGGNSSWLLPNRIYEGGMYHCPALALEGTETGKWLETNGLGVLFREDLYPSLLEFLSGFSVEAWQTLREKCAAAPDRLFAGEEDYAELTRKLIAMSGSSDD